MSHEHDQEFEKNWWSDCRNTLGEELKQLSYAKRMGLSFFHNGKSPYFIDMQGKSVLDIGGGPVSLLLKCENLGLAAIVDPCEYPAWVIARYKGAGITFYPQGAETIPTEGNVVDDVWIYNCLQHVVDPEKIIQNARKVGRVIRVFEWIDNGVSEGHPHNLTQEKLDEWLGGTGKVEMMNENTAKGKAYYGIFKGDHFNE